MKFLSVIALLIIALPVPAQKKKVDLLVYNAKIYTVDAKFSTATAMVIRNGRIEDAGSIQSMVNRYLPSRSVNAQGKFIYPGFIDAHAHFYRYGLGLQTADLVGTESWDEILTRLQAFARNRKTGWIVGRGWDQNDWKIKEFPTREKLDRLFPDRPVILTRIDGHAAIVNQKAIELAGIKAGDRVTGGTVEVKDGRLTGILIDNAADRVYAAIPDATPQEIRSSLLQGQQNCFAMGLTTVDDCGIHFSEALFMDSLQKKGILKMRVYAMLSDARSNYDFLLRKGVIKTDRMHIRSFKVYADGALGSRGAVLLAPYSDRPGWTGFLLSSAEHFDSVARILASSPFQMCTHAIGDSGNRTILNIYGKYLKGKNDRRWRIEHAQVVDSADFPLFGRYNIVPSVQPTHATSDMYWAEDRLGPHRVKNAYAFRQLMKQNGWIPLGTDFPVEDISPFKTFHAAVFRIDAKEFPAGGYQPENALSREDALRGMTIWAARSNFEEKEKGSIEKGKYADFIIVDTDLMTATPAQIRQASVLATYINGEKVYSRK